MWMRSWISMLVVAGTMAGAIAGTIAGAAGCRRTGAEHEAIATIGDGTTAACVAVSVCPTGKSPCAAEDLECPSGTTNCCKTNGPGVYAEEGGFAGIDVIGSPPTEKQPWVARKILITNFENDAQPAQSVHFDVGYLDLAQRWFPIGRGHVMSADYRGRDHLAVSSVHELQTAVTWTLRDPTTRAPIVVTGNDVAQLTLHISFPDGWGGSRLAGLQLGAARAATPPIQAYGLQWRDETSGPGSSWQTYCLDHRRQPDPVVFQRDIIVHPATGRVDHPTTDVVTLSCLHGAPATVFGWRYEYARGLGSPFYFDAGIQMKRAAYCGDAHAYTLAGTPIELLDDSGGPHSGGSLKALEARWMPFGAACVDLGHLRHPELGFSGACNGAPLPPCSPPTVPLTSHWLADGLPTP